MNPILKAYKEGVECGELVRDLTKIHPQPKSYVKKRLAEFLSSFAKNLLNAAKEAGPEKKESNFITGKLWLEDETFNDCRSSFHSAIDEGIKLIKE